MNDLLTAIVAHAWLTALVCSLFGYLAGSVSFARLVYFFVTKSTKLEPFSEPVPHSAETFESDLVSATLINKKLGARYGCLTSVLDMIKVALPTFITMVVLREQPWYLLTSLFGIIGHIYPVWHNFTGGRGESPILGSLLVINWFGLVIANAAGIILGFITGSVLVLRWSAYILLIFWFWIFFNTPWHIAYMILVCSLFWFSMRKDLKKFQELKKQKSIKFSEEDVSEFILMGKGIGRTLDNYSLYALVKKRFTKDHPK
ncbi:MAG TPA: glycerol-3-phosphate acyltransferase [Bacteroidales bacterium]|nr:glycerol-3-phosphate acyltransferase [Bacteroidales bacterium]